MIKFVCHCGNKMQASDDEAGLTLQCSRCGLLVDIPRVGDKDSLEGDGTYRLDSPTVGKPNENLDQLTLMYYPARQLPDGTEIDLRGPVQGYEEGIPKREGIERGRESERVGGREGEGAPRPKYDPTTGELVQAIEVGGPVKPPPSANLPEAKRVIDYNVSVNALGGSPHGMGIFAALFQPLNVIVMTMIFVAHMFFLMALIVGSQFLVLVAVPFAVMVFLAGHYGTVLEEMGPAERDELPRPLRNVHPWDDFMVPFAKVMFSLILCYWPIAVILIMNFVAAMDESGKELPFPAAGLWLLSVYAVGSIFFPAVFLTVCTSGTLLNLRPDRVVGLMYRASWQYVLFVVLWFFTGAIYLAGVVGTFAHILVLFSRMEMPIFLRVFITYPLLLSGIYLAHAFCWVLGSYYRQEWRNFPWVAQYHVPKKVVTLGRPKLHPKVETADQNAAIRAARRGVR